MLELNIKKNTTWSIKEIFNCDINKIKEEVSLYVDEWNIDKSRQNTYKTHKDTEMYQLRYMDYEWIPGNTLDFKDINNFKNTESIKEYNDILEKLESLYNGKVVRSELVKLHKNTEVRKHIDQGKMLSVSRRCHVPIITNNNVFFSVLNNEINMKEGVCYEINNAMPHGVKNNSDFDRVHLILDIILKEDYL